MSTIPFLSQNKLEDHFFLKVVFPQVFVHLPYNLILPPLGSPFSVVGSHCSRRLQQKPLGITIKYKSTFSIGQCCFPIVKSKGSKKVWPNIDLSYMTLENGFLKRLQYIFRYSQLFFAHTSYNNCFSIIIFQPDQFVLSTIYSSNLTFRSP